MQLRKDADSVPFCAILSVVFGICWWATYFAIRLFHLETNLAIAAMLLVAPLIALLIAVLELFAGHARAESKLLVGTMSISLNLLAIVAMICGLGEFGHRFLDWH
jgi:hypothetical protein